MKKVITVILVALTLMSLASAVYAEETGCYQTKDKWIIRVFSDGDASPYRFILEVVNPLTELNVPLSSIKAFSGVTPFQCLSGSTQDLCVIEANAQNTDVSLACDTVAGTAYVFHDASGQPVLTPIKDITSVSSVAIPVLTTSATSLIFGAVTVNTIKNLSLTVTNTGTANLNITTPIVSPAAPFSRLSDTCNVPLAPSGTCTITIQFKPTSSTQSYTGSFTILSNGGTATISLTGSGKIGSKYN